MRKFFPKSEFKRNVLILTIGTAISQGLMVLASPVLTRLFTPEDFGLFAIFVSVSSILGIIATGKYEIAIILPEKDEDAVNIVSLTVLITTVISGFFLIVFFVFNAQITQLLGSEEISFWLYFIPVNVFFTCLFTILSNWLTRNKRFRSLAFNKVMQSLIIVGVSVIFGVLRFGAAGLIIGTISGHLFISLFLFAQVWFKDKSKKELISSKQMKEQAKRYKDFPKFTVLSLLINTLAQQLPIILFGVFFSPAVAGFYALTQRVLGAPMTLISGSVSEVFRQRAASDYAKYGNCRSIFLKTLKTLVMFSFVPFLILFLTAPTLFAFVFGEEWREAGFYTQILSFMLFFRFFVSPITVFFIVGKQNIAMFLQLALLISSLTSIFLGVYFNEIKITLISISILYSLVYLTFIFLSYKFSKGFSNESNG